MSDDAWDVIVIGAGACGLMAAIRAAEGGARTLLLEKNRKPGVKILMSGGTRCNITHAIDNRGIVEAFGPSGRFLHSALAALSVDDTVHFFEAEGVATKVEETGKIFPVSNKAIDVLNALLNRLHRSGATLSLAEPVLDLRQSDGVFTITTPGRTLSARQVILTTGGQSYPGSGTTGDGYAFAARFGHIIVAPRPALVPIRVNAPWVAGLRGVTLPDVGLRVRDGETVLMAHRGSLLFAHFGLSGPVALDLSRAISGHPRPGDLTLEIDLLPATIEAAKKQLAVVLASRLPRSVCDILLTLAGLPADRRAAGLSKEDRRRLTRLIKNLSLPVIGTLGFEKAEVTAGGVALDEVDSRNIRSKLVPNLFIAGEVLDLDGPIGGYNFQSAWSTGWLAGMKAAER